MSLLDALLRVLNEHAQAVEWAHRQVRRGHYATSTEQALVALDDTIRQETK